MNFQRIKIDMGQLLVEGGEPERNIQRALEMLDLGVDRQCDIVPLPECLDLGWTHPSAQTEAQPIPALHHEQYCNLCKGK